ncbi:MAG TPA: TadE family protein [Candidatus Tectomicrobia bacterium]|nr:TadE family protein [Candidatus Tectomicrobia bacterium]
MWRLRPDQRGTSTLEFAAVLPFLCLILVTIIELSRAWFTLNVVTNAAREGVRAAVVATAANVVSDGQARMEAVLQSAGMTCQGNTCTITCSPNPCDLNSQVTANIQVPFDTIVPAFIPQMQNIVVRQTAVMRYEGP